MQKIGDRNTLFEMIKKSFHGHTCSFEDRLAPERLNINAC